jgi:hypothetical protein
MHGREEKRVQGFGGKAQRKKDHLEDQGIDGRMGSKWTLGRLDWIGLVWFGLVGLFVCLRVCLFACVFVCVCARARARACVRVCVCVEWICLPQVRDRWWAPVNAVMNLRVLAPRSLVSAETITVYDK